MPLRSAAKPPEPTGPGRSLRAIPGGYDIDRSPIACATLLTLPPQERHSPSLAELLNDIEAEISCWDTSKLILAARRLRKDGTRGIRLGEIVDIHNHLIDGTHRTGSPDLSRDGRITARATHTLESDHALWSNILSNDWDCGFGADPCDEAGWL